MGLSTTPTLWLLLGPRPGEIQQQRALAAAIGLPAEEKRAWRAHAGRGFGWSPDMAEACGLRAPWPDAVLSFGKTLEAARWIKHASGGRTRILQLGRTRGVALREIDLIVPLPHDRVPDAPNVLPLRMPLNLGTRGAQTAVAPWLDALPRPWRVLLLGGPSPYFNPRLADFTALIAAAAAQARSRGGSLCVSTSPRTPRDWLPALRAALPAPGHFHAYGESVGNPLDAYLARADGFIVSGDSASMIAQAWRSGRPLQLWAPPRRLRLGDWLRAQFLPERVERALVHRGHLAARCDPPGWIDTLIREGLAARFGDAHDATPSRVPDDDLARVVARVHEVLRGH